MSGILWGEGEGENRQQSLCLGEAYLPDTLSPKRGGLYQIHSQSLILRLKWPFTAWGNWPDAKIPGKMGNGTENGPRLRCGPRGSSHEKFHGAPSRKQACFLGGLLPLRNKGKRAFLEPHFASKKVLRRTFHGLPLQAPILQARHGRRNGKMDPKMRCRVHFSI